MDQHRDGTRCFTEKIPANSALATTCPHVVGESRGTGPKRDGIELHGTGWDWDGIGTGKVETGHATGRDVGTGLESAERPAPGRQRDGTYRDRDGTGLNRGRIVHAA